MPCMAACSRMGLPKAGSWTCGPALPPVPRIPAACSSARPCNLTIVSHRFLANRGRQAAPFSVQCKVRRVGLPLLRRLPLPAATFPI